MTRKNKRLYLMAALFIALGMTGCIEKTTLVSIPEAENSLFTATGRLFVTGGESIYEITKDDNGVCTAHKLYPGTYNFLGIGQHGDYIYVNRTSPGAGFLFNPESHLVIANLNDILMSGEENESNGVFTEIRLNSVQGPVNGMAIDSHGCIYIADMFGGRILSAFIQTGDPTMVSEFFPWLEEGVASPNGIAVSDATLYFTDGNAVKKVGIQEDGSPGAVEIIAEDLGVLDDLAPFRDGVLVTVFNRGMLLYITDDGIVMNQTPWKSFSGPSSVIPGRAPMFQAQDIIVTERGILLDTRSSIGNKVSMFNAMDWFAE